MIVGVDLLGSKFASKNLNGTVGNDLVRVHVGLGAGAGLPDDKREVVVKLSFDDFVGGLDDSISNLGLESEVLVGAGGTLLEKTEGLDNGKRHSLAFTSNLEVHERSLSLSTPVTISWHLKWTESI